MAGENERIRSEAAGDMQSRGDTRRRTTSSTVTKEDIRRLVAKLKGEDSKK